MQSAGNTISYDKLDEVTENISTFALPFEIMMNRRRPYHPQIPADSLRADTCAPRKLMNPHPGIYPAPRNVPCYWDASPHGERHHPATDHAQWGTTVSNRAGSPTTSVRQAPRRSAGHAATHPVPPLKGLPGTRATDVSYRASVPAGHAGRGVALSYRALAPGGAGF